MAESSVQQSLIVVGFWLPNFGPNPPLSLSISIFQYFNRLIFPLNLHLSAADSEVGGRSFFFFRLDVIVIGPLKCATGTAHSAIQPPFMLK